MICSVFFPFQFKYSSFSLFSSTLFLRKENEINRPASRVQVSCERYGDSTNDDYSLLAGPGKLRRVPASTLHAGWLKHEFFFLLLIIMKWWRTQKPSLPTGRERGREREIDTTGRVN